MQDKCCQVFFCSISNRDYSWFVPILRSEAQIEREAREVITRGMDAQCNECSLLVINIIIHSSVFSEFLGIFELRPPPNTQMMHWGEEVQASFLIHTQFSLFACIIPNSHPNI